MATDPRDPNGYGVTIGYYSMQPQMSLKYGVDCVVDDILVRLSTAFLWYEPGYGFDVQNLVNSGVAPVDAVSMIEKQIKQDPRVQNAISTYSFDGTNLQVYVDVTLTGGEQFQLVGLATSLGSFSFTVEANS